MVFLGTGFFSEYYWSPFRKENVNLTFLHQDTFALISSKIHLSIKQPNIKKHRIIQSNPRHCNNLHKDYDHKSLLTSDERKKPINKNRVTIVDIISGDRMTVIDSNKCRSFISSGKKRNYTRASEILIKIPLRHRRLEYGYRFWRRNYFL